MRQPPPRTVIRTIRQPPSALHDATSSIEIFDDDVMSIVRDSPQDVGWDEDRQDDDATPPVSHSVQDGHGELLPRRRRSRRARERTGERGPELSGETRAKSGEDVSGVEEEDPVGAALPGEFNELGVADQPSEMEPRRRLASLALASGTGEDVAALGAKGPRPRMRLAMKPFRVLMVFLAVLLLVLWGWLALRIVPASGLASGDGPESSELNEADNAARNEGDNTAKDETAAKNQTNDKRKEGREQESPGGLEKIGDEGSKRTETASGTGKESSGAAGTVVVYISGAVAQPGVYTLPAASRANDLVTAAGGMTDNADPAGINLAAPLVDSQHVHIPEPGEAAPPDTSGATASDPGEGGGGAGGLININTAGESELQELPGIGPALSGAIIQWRDEHGSFASVDDLLDVPGVGPAKLSQLRERATV